MDEVDLSDFSKRGEVWLELFLAKSGDEGAVVVDVRYQFDGAVDGDSLSFEVFAYCAEEAEPDFLDEDVKHVLVRAAD